MSLFLSHVDWLSQSRVKGRGILNGKTELLRNYMILISFLELPETLSLCISALVFVPKVDFGTPGGRSR